MIAGPAAALRQQARRTVLFKVAQQAEYLAPVQADQRAGIGNPKPPRLNSQQHVKPAELLLAHRQHRHDASPGTPKSRGVSSLCGTGVPSLYCGYSFEADFRHYVAAATGLDASRAALLFLLCFVGR